jgi:hypothetical protein
MRVAPRGAVVITGRCRRASGRRARLAAAPGICGPAELRSQAPAGGRRRHMMWHRRDALRQACGGHRGARSPACNGRVVGVAGAARAARSAELARAVSGRCARAVPGRRRTCAAARSARQLAACGFGACARAVPGRQGTAGGAIGRKLAPCGFRAMRSSVPGRRRGPRGGAIGCASSRRAVSGAMRRRCRAAKGTAQRRDRLREFAPRGLRGDARERLRGGEGTSGRRRRAGCAGHGGATVGASAACRRCPAIVEAGQHFERRRLRRWRRRRWGAVPPAAPSPCQQARYRRPGWAVRTTRHRRFRRRRGRRGRVSGRCARGASTARRAARTPASAFPRWEPSGFRAAVGRQPSQRHVQNAQLRVAAAGAAPVRCRTG